MISMTVLILRTCCKFRGESCSPSQNWCRCPPFSRRAQSCPFSLNWNHFKLYYRFARLFGDTTTSGPIFWLFSFDDLGFVLRRGCTLPLPNRWPCDWVCQQAIEGGSVRLWCTIVSNVKCSWSEVVAHFKWSLKMAPRSKMAQQKMAHRNICSIQEVFCEPVVFFFCWYHV